jgi:hypothetical protein
VSKVVCWLIKALLESVHNMSAGLKLFLNIFGDYSRHAQTNVMCKEEGVKT